MKINCWGCRGSIPVSGPEYVRYGGDTTCIEIRTADGEVVVVDCGTGARRLGHKLAEEKRKKISIIFTHAHWDHIIGFPFFRPLYRGGTEVHLYGSPGAQESINTTLLHTMSPPYFPVDASAVKAAFLFNASCSTDFAIGSLEIKPIALNHPNQGMGYKFVENGKSFVFLTDNELEHPHPGGLRYEDYRAFAAGSDLLIHDAEFTDDEYRRTRGWGHSTYRRALQLAMEAGVRRFGLFHHNAERADAQIDAIVEDCRRIVAAKKSRLEVFALTQTSSMDL
jgi:phosphoribosyl 1,2-cyclic phosphodiesterase